MSIGLQVLFGLTFKTDYFLGLSFFLFFFWGGGGVL